MATSEQIISLIKSYLENDRERFSTIALQVAAHEARQGHTALAYDIRSLVDQAKAASQKVIPLNKELEDLVLLSHPQERLSDLIVSDAARKRLERILREFRQKDSLKKHGLCNRRKLLLTGPPGTGKTMTSSILAGELHLPLFLIMMDKLVTKFMGETSAKLRQIFHAINERIGVYLFDEFDAIGAERALDNDVGEMRRVLNSFLQFIEHDNSESLIVAATNNRKILDQALFRRFDDVLHYNLPTEKEAQHLIANRLAAFKAKRFPLVQCSQAALPLSHAEIAQACDDAIKEAILDNTKTVSGKLLCQMLEERHSAYGRQKNG
ncbi:MAG: AAA family ATPase [bacterium]